jgi:hypothetical protein
LLDVKDPTVSRQSAHNWRGGCRPYAQAALYYPKTSEYCYFVYISLLHADLTIVVIVTAIIIKFNYYFVYALNSVTRGRLQSEREYKTTITTSKGRISTRAKEKMRERLHPLRLHDVSNAICRFTNSTAAQAYLTQTTVTGGATEHGRVTYSPSRNIITLHRF